jgi:hypothetical protein
MVQEELHQLVEQPQIVRVVADLAEAVEPSCMAGLVLQLPETEVLLVVVVRQLRTLILLLAAQAACSVVAAALLVVPAPLMLEMAVLRVEVAVLVVIPHDLRVLAAEAL